MKPFRAIAIVIFLLIAIAHLLRLFFRWEVIVNNIPLPLWVSAVAAIFLTGLACMLWLESNSNKQDAVSQNGSKVPRGGAVHCR
jgi:hypothetical protein